MIRDAQKNGLSIDDIAKMFSKTLNAVQQEDQKKKAIKDARTELIEHMKDQFETAVSKGHLDCTDAAALYTLTMAEKYPDWTAENIKDYFQIIKLNAETTATMVGKEPDRLSWTRLIISLMPFLRAKIRVTMRRLLISCGRSVYKKRGY